MQRPYWYFGLSLKFWGGGTENILRNRNVVAFVRNCLVKMTLRLFYPLSFVTTMVPRNFSKHFSLLLFGGKNSIFNWVSKLNLSFFSLQWLIFHYNYRSSIPYTLSATKALQIGYIFSVFSLEVCFPAIYWVSNHKIFTVFHGPSWERFECHWP